MSRTDHHRPWRIRAADHSEANPRAYFLHLCAGHGDHGRCGWTLPHHVLRHPPHWFINDVWTGAERRRERDDLRAIAQQYNAGQLEEDDSDFANYQHRHNGDWLWS